MAIAVRLRAPSATREQYFALDDALGNWTTAHGGPPDGFMSYAAYAEDEGFGIFLVWRNEQLWRQCWDDVMHPLFEESGIAVAVAGQWPLLSLVKG